MSYLKKTLLIVILTVSVSLHSEAERLKVGLALSGGGARGLAHIGTLKVIDELGIKIDYIAGTSMGAVVGGLYSLGYSGQEIEEMLVRTDISGLFSDTLQRNDYYVGEKRWKEYYIFSFDLDENWYPSLPQGFIGGNTLINFLFDKTYEYNHINSFDDLPIPFSCIATDLVTGEMIVYRTGSLPEVIRASISVPSIFEPFSYEDRLTIDGGIKMNLPSPIVKKMGADYVIGVMVTSDLRGKERLNNPIAILDQTINISSLTSKESAIKECDFIVFPDLAGMLASDFGDPLAIIQEGESAARKAFKQIDLAKLTPNKTPDATHHSTSSQLPETLSFSNIRVEGNKYLSNTKVINFTKLETNTEFSKDDIKDGINAAYRTNLFKSLYPVIRENDGELSLLLIANEKPRNRLGVNFKYNENDDITVGAVLEMKNYFGNNSSFIAAISIGGLRELSMDYVKNFGREWGAYFRIFPYLNEHTLYIYDENIDRITHSNNSLEYGISVGIGGFFFDSLIIEPYLFSYQKRLYGKITYQDLDDQFFSTGLGLKLFHETLDNTMFPMRGREVFMKYSAANEDVLSDYSYQKFYGRWQYLLPIYSSSSASIDYEKSQQSIGKSNNILDRLSLRFKFEYGSYFDGEYVEFDPFYVGGIDSFIGLYQYQKSAPVVKVLTGSLRANFFDKAYMDLQLNVGNLSSNDKWDIDSDTIYGAGITLGYKTVFAPVRIGMGVNSDRKFNSYLSLGYDFDAFEFSRR